MDEAQIVARDEAIARANEPEARVQPSSEPTKSDTTKYDSIDIGTKMDIFRQLDIDMNYLSDNDVSDKVKDITDWAQIKSPDMNLRDIVFMIQDIQSKHGRAGRNSPLENVWQYARLDFERMKIDGQIKLMENNG